MMTQTPLTQEQLASLQQQADEFSKTFANAQYEMGEAQKFINALCIVYGVNWLHSVDFERRVKKANRRGINRIDGFLPGLLLIEMKSAGEDLDKAFEQALHYVQLLEKESDKPRHILVSDFQNLHLYELNDRFTAELPDKTVKFALADFRANVEALAFMGGYERIIAERNEALTIAAAEKLAALHDAFLSEGYSGKDLQTMLVRLLFCLFADDTELFEEDNVFENFIKNSPADGADLGYRLQDLFEWLNTNEAERQQTAKPLWEEHHGFRKALPYINGKLFAEKTQRFIFNAQMRSALIDCCELDWGEISPDIFGTLFQNIMESADGDKEKKHGKKSQHRRDFGAHYTSERNIRRAIEPLFLNELKKEFEQAQDDAKKLKKLLEKVQTVQILDPACGCGNFLIVTYREMRLLETQVIRALEAFGVHEMSYCDVHQFHGFEIDSAACEIATVAMWLTDHQMNRRYQDGYKRIPLTNRADIHCVNALSENWVNLLGEGVAKNIAYIVGNPPFLGKTYQSASQKEDMKRIAGNIKNFATLDYVCGWYIQAVKFMQQFANVQTAFVSTNSITQGEQVAILWQPLIDAGLYIRFAHRTFKWANEGSGVAVVHCVIIGFSLIKPKLGFRGQIWDYSENVGAERGKIELVKRINPYLIEAENLIIEKRTKPISNEPELVNGSKVTDGGNLLLTTKEKEEIIVQNPLMESYIKPFTGAEEFLNGKERWCLWFRGISEEDLRNLLENTPLAKARVKNVRTMREASRDKATKKDAATPHLFQTDRQPYSDYLIVPSTSSERRAFIPVDYVSAEVINSNANFSLPNATLYHFGILCSTMHNAFMRTVAGRLESRYRYSNTIVYNNFPFPNVDEEAKTTIGEYAQAILDARKAHPKMTLAQLYNPETMPMNLKQAHAALDDVIDDAYGYTSGNSDAQRVAFLFELLK